MILFGDHHHILTPINGHWLRLLLLLGSLHLLAQVTDRDTLLVCARHLNAILVDELEAHLAHV